MQDEVVESRREAAAEMFWCFWMGGMKEDGDGGESWLRNSM